MAGSSKLPLSFYHCDADQVLFKVCNHKAQAVVIVGMFEYYLCLPCKQLLNKQEQHKAGVVNATP